MRAHPMQSNAIAGQPIVVRGGGCDFEEEEEQEEKCHRKCAELCRSHSEVVSLSRRLSSCRRCLIETLPLLGSGSCLLLDLDFQAVRTFALSQTTLFLESHCNVFLSPTSSQVTSFLLLHRSTFTRAILLETSTSLSFAAQLCDFYHTCGRLLRFLTADLDLSIRADRHGSPRCF
ncbi:hypothetical protein PHSY_007240 [Pseudozyma hubeiensis SY62]|uniref:Uncharacterized protein n=1 Tax=Pseudozyma hubeiensis (strain SY62) TaxID=1305764 RepID=R9PEF3_PSEHS|nr:hypothetical protein PHSY_007240 [Pseudozyma hubeiensis SY62]GAC99637.1 hypothetical protein PHSY_007240 [Pseudozyma hubeiensis SY62]